MHAVARAARLQQLGRAHRDQQRRAGGQAVQRAKGAEHRQRQQQRASRTRAAGRAAMRCARRRAARQRQSAAITASGTDHHGQVMQVQQQLAQAGQAQRTARRRLSVVGGRRAVRSWRRVMARLPRYSASARRQRLRCACPTPVGRSVSRQAQCDSVRRALLAQRGSRPRAATAAPRDRRPCSCVEIEQRVRRRARPRYLRPAAARRAHRPSRRRRAGCRRAGRGAAPAHSSSPLAGALRRCRRGAAAQRAAASRPCGAG